VRVRSLRAAAVQHVWLCVIINVFIHSSFNDAVFALNDIALIFILISR